MTLLKIIIAIWCGYILTLSSASGDPSNPLVRQLNAGGYVLLIRHALAPGTGDPDNFKIGDCTTQRNLNDQGRAQARDIGQWLRSQGIASARVYASQWCRCLETAQHLGFGPVSELPALNSFFERPQDREPNLADLRIFLGKQPADGGLIILVTHYVTIAAITGQSVASGEGMVIRLKSEGRHEVLGRLGFEY